MIPLIIGAVAALAEAKKKGGSAGGSALPAGDKSLHTGIFQVGRGNVATAVETSPEKAGEILQNTQPFSPIAAESKQTQNLLLIGGGLVAILIIGYVIVKGQKNV